MKIFGITGSIATGKSTVTNYLRDKAAARYQVTGSVKDYLASQSQFL